ncbi:hypothetical protein T11_16099, partial [Trichinella zimbabwensis]
LIPAIQGNFPNTRVQGCFFHFCQAVLRQVGRLGLGNDYANNHEHFAGESCARGFRNLKCWGVGSTGSLVLVLPLPLKYRFGTFMACLCGPTTIWKVGTTA